MIKFKCLCNPRVEHTDCITHCGYYTFIFGERRRSDSTKIASDYGQHLIVRLQQMPENCLRRFGCASTFAEFRRLVDDSENEIVTR